ncbi:TIGR01244 family sulfur transferase [Celerinatantimonas yamalensis]|uniref:TIGR01244 family sulfur transferase n=1 Tax=Celerinatantimonas yamalensis TaxID=559956 RepID=A0ABW9G7N8_9GAMM
MIRKKITEQYSVSEQLTPEDVDVLARDGVTHIICNRPDDEEAGQRPFTEIAAIAKEKGMQAIHIPFVAGGMQPTHVAAFKEAMRDAKCVHAYCRSGNRSHKIWQAAQQTDNHASVGQHTHQYDVVIVGAGSAGISTAASISKRNSSLRICLIDPSVDHFYQPGWTLVGCGVFESSKTRRNMADVIPKGAKWLNESVKTFIPTENKVLLENGQIIDYHFLVIAAGIQLNWNAIEGLSETLGQNGVTSNYRYDLAPYTWKLVHELKGGKAVFTQPPMPIKCAGAPQKAMYLSCDYWLKHNKLHNFQVSFCNAGGVLFGVSEYVPALESYVRKYNAKLHFGQTLVRVDGPNHRAYFATKNEQGEPSEVEVEFDMLHVCPPQSAPDFIRESPLVDESGWVDVDRDTLQHKSFDNVWSLGDVCNAPNAKTLAAVRKQAPVVAQNIVDAWAGKSLRATYDGYGSCPLTVERGKIVLAEFTYGGKVAPTFPKWVNDGTKATSFAWILKKDILPPFYWQGMLKGYEWFVKPKMRS